MAFAYARAPSIATRVAPTDFGIARSGFRCVGTDCLFAKTLNNLHQLTGDDTASAPSRSPRPIFKQLFVKVLEFCEGTRRVQGVRLRLFGAMIAV